MPKNMRGDLPIILTRTPGAERVAEAAELIQEGYIFVNQDIRGRYASEGQFSMFWQPRDKHDAKALDESTDTYDTIEWLLKNVPHNNGRVGTLGMSSRMLGSSPAVFTRSHDLVDVCYNL